MRRPSHAQGMNICRFHPFSKKNLAQHHIVLMRVIKISKFGRGSLLEQATLAGHAYLAHLLAGAAETGAAHPGLFLLHLEFCRKPVVFSNSLDTTG